RSYAGKSIRRKMIREVFDQLVNDLKRCRAISHFRQLAAHISVITVFLFEQLLAHRITNQAQYGADLLNADSSIMYCLILVFHGGLQNSECFIYLLKHNPLNAFCKAFSVFYAITH